jgi:tetratricopeptide (TPR) repeat protein
VLVLGLALGIAWRWLRRHRTWQLLALVWLVAFLIPTSGIISIRHIRADRYLYCVLPAALLLAVGALGTLSWRRSRVIVAGCYLYFATGLYFRSVTWRSDDSLWAREVQLDAGCREGWARLGNLASFRNDYVTSGASYEKALSLNPSIIAFSPRAEVLHNLGVSYMNLDQFELARERLREALEVAGSESVLAGPILYQWALSYVAERDCAQALPLLKRVRALQLTPSLSLDNNQLLAFCAGREGRDHELLSHVQLGLRGLEPGANRPLTP